MEKLNLVDLELCEVGGMVQTMHILVEECSVHSFPGSTRGLHVSAGGGVR